MDKIKEQQILQKLREANDRLVKAVQNGDWAKIAIYQQVRDKIQSEYDDIMEAKQFKLQTDNQDKALTSWGGKSLACQRLKLICHYTTLICIWHISPAGTTS